MKFFETTVLGLGGLISVALVLSLLVLAALVSGCNAPPINDDWWRTVEVCDGEGVCKNIIIRKDEELK